MAVIWIRDNSCASVQHAHVGICWVLRRLDYFPSFEEAKQSPAAPEGSPSFQLVFVEKVFLEVVQPLNHQLPDEM
eukprot:6463166-Amphidinium_carterae.2